MRIRDNRVVGVYEYSKKMPEFFTNRNGAENAKVFFSCYSSASLRLNCFYRKGAKNAKTLLSFNSIDRAQLTFTKSKPLAVLSTQYLVLKKAQLTFTKSLALAFIRHLSFVICH
jgi:hypothetical protein